MTDGETVHAFLTRKAAAQEVNCSGRRASALLAARMLEVVLKHHRPVDEGDPACVGCGLDAYEDMAVGHIDECPVLSAIAEIYLEMEGK